MKYLNSIFDFLLESVESYKWEMTTDTDKLVKYTFEDAIGNKYLVEFKNIPRLKSSVNDLGTEYELSYFVYDEKSEYYTVSKLVNVNPYKTIQTVLGDIVKDFIKRKSWVKKITMTGLSKDMERTFVSQRTKIYSRYLERNPIDGYRIETLGNKIYIIKK